MFLFLFSLIPFPRPTKLLSLFQTLDHLMAGIEDVLGRMGNNQIRNR